MIRTRSMFMAVALGASVIQPGLTWADPPRETLLIAGSPSLASPLKALAEAYEARHPGIRIRLYLDTSLELRRLIASVENSRTGDSFIGRGPIHLVAPGGDELISRLEQKYYVLPGSARAYAEERLVLVVPESLADDPGSFEGLAKRATVRVAVADPDRTSLGKQTQGLLQAFGLNEALQGRLDVASDSRGVLDHLLSGAADLGIIFMHEAVKERDRVRVVAVAERGYQPTVHSMAMERRCPNRALCEDFLAFLQTPEAQEVIRSTGYAPPGPVDARSAMP